MVTLKAQALVGVFDISIIIIDKLILLANFDIGINKVMFENRISISTRGF